MLHNSVPELSLDEIDLSCSFLGKKLQIPVILDAITGGTEQAGQINRLLASIASRYGMAMAVGSQTVAINNPALSETFAVAREINPEGILIANIGAGRSVDEAIEAVNMIKADALQLHFNVPQELAMAEGDRSFKGILANVKDIVANSPVPVIAKEVGFGLSRESIQALFAAGVRIFDSSGKGGTNFIIIEDQRQGVFNNELDNWGIPTAVSLMEAVTLDLPVVLIASGGIRTALDTAKALALGADMVGIAGAILRLLVNQGKESVNRMVEDFIYRLKAVMLMCGAGNITELRQKPVLIMGNTAEWLRLRGIAPALWAR